MSKKYEFVEPEVTRDEMVNVLVKGLERSLTDQEVRTINWLSDCEYITRVVLLDLFKEMKDKIDYYKVD